MLANLKETRIVEPLFQTRGWLPCFAFTGLLSPLYLFNHLAFHLVAEFSTVFIAFAIFFLGVSTYRFSENSLFVYLGTAYFWIAVIDISHSLQFPGMQLFGDDGGDRSIQYWLLGRYGEAIVLASVPFMKHLSCTPRRAFVLLGAITALGHLVVETGVFPSAYIDGSGLTRFKIISELAIIAILVIGAFLCLKFRRDIDKDFFPWLIWAIAFTAISEFFFTQYTTTSEFWIFTGHVLKGCSFWMLFVGAWMVSLEQPFIRSQLLAEAVDQSPTTVMITSPEPEIQYVNKAFTETTGYSEDEVIGQNPRFLSAGHTPIETYKEMWGRLTTGRSWTGFFDNKRKSGSEFTEQATISSIKDSNGKILHYVSTKEDITDKKRTEEFLADDENAIHLTLLGAIGAVSDLLEARDPYTAGHSKRVSELAVSIAKEMNLSAARIEGLRLAGLIHDIGKIKIPMEILNKPTRLSEEEFALVKHHSETGYQAIKNIPFPMDIPSIVRAHHEKWDGTGYPQGLKGDEIPLEAQILSIADVIESITSHRPYRPALGIDKAFEVVEEWRGTAFNSEIVDAALRTRDKGVFTEKNLL